MKIFKANICKGWMCDSEWLNAIAGESRREWLCTYGVCNRSLCSSIISMPYYIHHRCMSIYNSVSKSSRTILLERSLLTLDVKFLPSPSKYSPFARIQRSKQTAIFGSIPGSPCLELCQISAAIPLESLQWCRMFDPSSEASAWGRGKSHREPDRVTMGDGGSLSCCSGPKIAKI